MINEISRRHKYFKYRSALATTRCEICSKNLFPPLYMVGYVHAYGLVRIPVEEFYSITSSSTRGGRGRFNFPDQEILYDWHSSPVELAMNFWGCQRNTPYQTNWVSTKGCWPVSSGNILGVYRLLFIIALNCLLVVILVFPMFSYCLFVLLHWPHI